ncbi:predicted protein [Botrytis cinerea T4]|uniref:Uncharacterized protein n=1 Tax=Botryotinia fuckeliana (strain T4) TaxID=999810 RepID=G2YBR5_BOTF4|nr:predicted protein [Botrytis cinerea T4]
MTRRYHNSSLNSGNTDTAEKRPSNVFARGLVPLFHNYNEVIIG